MGLSLFYYGNILDWVWDVTPLYLEFPNLARKYKTRLKLTKLLVCYITVLITTLKSAAVLDPGNTVF